MNEKITIKLITPWGIQKDIITAVNDPAIDVVVVSAGRGIGKSILLENIAVEKCLNIPGVKVLIVSPTESNNNKIYDDIIIALENSGAIRTSTKQSGSAKIEFLNTSIIIFRTGSNENARGIRADFLIVDEAAKINKKIFDAVFIPTLAGSPYGKMALFSTPRGQANWYYEYFNKQFTNKKFKSFTCASWESPYMTEKLLNNFKENLPAKVYQQEVEAKFIDGASLFNNIDDLMTLTALNEPESGRIYYGGIDVGLINDATVLSIIDDGGNLVNQIAFNGVQTPELIEKLIEIEEKWKFKKCFIETNGQGLPIYQSLRKRMKSIEEFTTTASSKKKIIDKLIYLFNTKGFNLIKDAELQWELQSFILIQGEGGRDKYEADFGAHDDRVMSLAIAIKCYDEYKAKNNKSNYRVF